MAALIEAQQGSFTSGRPPFFNQVFGMLKRDNVIVHGMQGTQMNAIGHIVMQR